MATTEARIGNHALLRVGITQPIQNFRLGKTNEDDALLIFYDDVLEWLLETHTWDWSQNIKALTLVTKDPNPKWGFSHRWPVDAVRANRIVNVALMRNEGAEDLIPYQLGNDGTGRVVFSDEAEPILEYNLRIVDPSLFPGLFANVLAWRLAYEIAIPLSNSPNLRNTAEVGYKEALTEAKAAAAAQRQFDQPPKSELERARI